MPQPPATFCQPSGLAQQFRLPEIEPRPSMSELNGGCGKSAPPSWKKFRRNCAAPPQKLLFSKN
jgi:hypothetical protein